MSAVHRLALLAAGAVLASACASVSAAPDPLPSTLQHQTQTHRVLRCTFPPGVGHERHYHPAHYGYALSGGTMRITDETGVRTVTLETGSDYSSDGTAWHEVVNVGDTPVIYLMVEKR